MLIVTIMCVAQLFCVPADPVDHPFGDRADQAVIFGDRQKPLGFDESQPAMPPTQ